MIPFGGKKRKKETELIQLTDSMIITYKKVARLFEKNALQVAYKVTE